MTVNDDTPARTGRRIVVVGGGIGGAEAAMTLSIGLPGDDVTLIGRWDCIRILPDLVYVPFGVSTQRIDVPLAELLPHGVRSIVAEVEHIDAAAQRVRLSSGEEIAFDVLIAAPGATSCKGKRSSLRTLDDARRLRDQLAQVVAEAAAGEHRTITIREDSDDSWTAPAVETALLVGAWVRSRGLDDKIETMLVTSDSRAFEWFGTVGESTIDAALRRTRVKVATGVPSGRLSELDGDLVISFGEIEPRTIEGLPGRGASGWYEPDACFRVAPNVFVIGDAIELPYRAGFATAWQARKVLHSLGGDPAKLGLSIDGIPTESVEYQMDLADSVMRARVVHAETLAHPFLGHDAEIEVVAGGRPDKLQGLLLHDRVLRWDQRVVDAPLAYRDALHDHEVTGA